MREAQTVHAAGESSPGNLPKNTHAVVLAANEATLLELSKRLESDGISHAAIREVDPPYTDQLMAIGIAPCFRDDVRRYLSSLPLLRENNK